MAVMARIDTALPPSSERSAVKKQRINNPVMSPILSTHMVPLLFAEPAWNMGRARAARQKAFTVPATLLLAALLPCYPPVIDSEDDEARDPRLPRRTT